MKLYYYSLLFFLFVSFSINSNCIAQQKVEEICKKYIESIGGDVNLKKLNNVVIEQQLILNNTEFPQRVIIINNHAYYMETEYPGQKAKIAVIDSTGWQINPFITGNNNPIKLNRKEVNLYKYQTDLTGPFFNSQEKKIIIKLIGQSKVNGVESYNLEVTYSTGYVANVFMSVKDFMINKIIDKNREVNFSDYKKVNGIMFPFVTEINFGNQSMIYNVIKINTNMKIDNSLFLFPK